MLKYIVSSLDEVPEALRSFYKQVGDKFVLQVDGAVPKERLDEFRTTNTTIMKELSDLKAQFKDVDPAKYAELLAIENDLKEKKLKGTDAEKLLEQRTAEMKKAHDKQVADLTAANDAMKGELSQLRIADAAVQTATKLGLRAGAAEDLIARANRIFKLEDGKPVAYGADGKRYNALGELYSIENFVEELAKSAPHLFEPSSGSGAEGDKNKGGSGGGDVNPWKRETFNLTLQGKILREDKVKAERLAKAAGVTLKLPR